MSNASRFGAAHDPSAPASYVYSRFGLITPVTPLLVSFAMNAWVVSKMYVLLVTPALIVSASPKSNAKVSSPTSSSLSVNGSRLRRFETIQPFGSLACGPHVKIAPSPPHVVAEIAVLLQDDVALHGVVELGLRLTDQRLQTEAVGEVVLERQHGLGEIDLELVVTALR